MTCRIVPSFPAASIAWKMTSRLHVSCAARRIWNSLSHWVPWPSSSDACSFLTKSPEYRGSKSFGSRTLEPGLTLSGAMNSWMRSKRLSGISRTTPWRDVP